MPPGARGEGAEAQVLLHRQVREDHPAFGDQGDAGRDPARGIPTGDGLSVEPDLPRRGGEQPRQETQSRRLAGAVAADQRGDAVAGDREADAVEHLHGAIAADQRLRGQDRVAVHDRAPR